MARRTMAALVALLVAGCAAQPTPEPLRYSWTVARADGEAEGIFYAKPDAERFGAELNAHKAPGGPFRVRPATAKDQECAP